MQRLLIKIKIYIENKKIEINRATPAKTFKIKIKIYIENKNLKLTERPLQRLFPPLPPPTLLPLTTATRRSVDFYAKCKWGPAIPLLVSFYADVAPPRLTMSFQNTFQFRPTPLIFLERTILKPFFLSSLGHLGLLSSLDTHGNIVFEILISQHIAYVGVLKHFYLYICFSVCHL